MRSGAIDPTVLRSGTIGHAFWVDLVGVLALTPVDFGLTARLINVKLYADLPPHVVDVPSARVGAGARVDVYEDSRVFNTEPRYLSISPNVDNRREPTLPESHG